MPLENILIRLLIGALIIWLFEKLIAVFPIDVRVKEIINAVVIIVVVLWAILGLVLTQ